PGPVGPLASPRPLGVCSLYPFAHLDRDDCRDCRGMAGSATLYRLPLDADAARVLWAVGESARLAPLALGSAVYRTVHCTSVGQCRLAISGGTYAATPRDVSGCWFRGRHCRTGAWEAYAPHRWGRHV